MIKYLTEKGLFILGMHGWSNIQKLINTIHFNSIKKNHRIMSTDAGKTFYRTQHPFVINTLSKVEKGNLFNVIKTSM